MLMKNCENQEKIQTVKKNQKMNQKLIHWN